MSFIPHVQGHGTWNDNLDESQTPVGIKAGYLGDIHRSDDDVGNGGYDVSATEVNTPANPDYTPDSSGMQGAGGYQVIGGWKQAGTSAFDQDVDRYRKMGQDGQARAPVQIDQTQGNESRGLEMGALGMLRAQGDGSAPSSAQIMSGRANQGAVQNAAQQVTAARGIGSSIAAAQGAGQQAGQAMLAGNAANADTRAAEISRGQGAYSGAAAGMRGQDIGVATADAGLAAQQRALNEAHQQGMERRAWDTRNTEQQASDRFIRNQQDQSLALRQQEEAGRAADSAAVDRAIGMGLGAATMASDPHTKADVRPMTMGSLASLHRGRRH